MIRVIVTIILVIYIIFSFLILIARMEDRNIALRKSFKYEICINNYNYYANEFLYTNGILTFRDGYRSNELFIATQFTIKTQHN